MTDPFTPVLVKVSGEVIGAILNAGFRDLLRARVNQAEEILRKRAAKGRPWLVTEEAAAGALFAYFRAAAEGVARRNLDLMAEALSSLAAEPAFAPDEFRRQALRIADLTYEEIVLLAAFLRAPAQEEGVTDPSHAWNFACKELRGKSAFPDLASLVQWATALQRTGYVVVWPVMQGIHFTPTHLLTSLARLVDLEEAARD
ncbi:MAG TPA: hypothetical protein VN805_06900 [Caulobacteraceae bacterium]|nr:hypothetical protein [Caulobacteraceae bacterium]